MATYATIVYSNSRKAFTVNLRLFSVDTLNLYYSDNTTSPAPDDVLTGASLIDPNDYEVIGLNAAANSVTVKWPDAPAAGTLIAERVGNATRISSFPANQAFPIEALDNELDHILTLIDSAQDEVDDHETRLTAAEADIDDHETRVTALETDALLEVGGVWDGEGKRLTDIDDPTANQDAATKIYVDSAVGESGAVPGVTNAGQVGQALVATDDDPDAWAWGEVETAGIADDAITTDKLRVGAVTLAKQANLAANKLIGRATASTGAPEAVDVGDGLAMSAGALTLSVTYSVTTPASDTVTGGGITSIETVSNLASGVWLFLVTCSVRISVGATIFSQGAMILEKDTGGGFSDVASVPFTLGDPALADSMELPLTLAYIGTANGSDDYRLRFDQLSGPGATLAFSNMRFAKIKIG